MTEILAFIVQYCTFLWANGRYRIVDSGVGSGFGDGYVIVESAAVKLTFLRDRGQLFLDITGKARPGKNESYSIDIVRRLMTGEKVISAELDEAQARFLRQSLDEIEAMFSNEADLPELRKRLREVERVRSTERAG